MHEHVELLVDKGPYKAGAKGCVVEDFDDGNVIVEIHEDSNGKTVDPPFPLPPSSLSDYRVIGNCP